MPRMSPQTQQKLGFSDAQVNFDEFLQMDDGPEKDSIARQRGYKKDGAARKNLALQGLKKQMRRNE